jgi:hypothetical protein
MRNPNERQMLIDARQAFGDRLPLAMSRELTEWLARSDGHRRVRISLSASAPMSLVRRLNLFWPSASESLRLPALAVPGGVVTRDSHMGRSIILVRRAGLMLLIKRVVLAHVFSRFEGTLSPPVAARMRSSADRAMTAAILASEAALALGRLPPDGWTSHNAGIVGYAAGTVGETAWRGFRAPGVRAHGFFVRTAGSASGLSLAAPAVEHFLDSVESGTLHLWHGLAGTAPVVAGRVAVGRDDVPQAIVDAVRPPEPLPAAVPVDLADALSDFADPGL